MLPLIKEHFLSKVPLGNNVSEMKVVSQQGHQECTAPLKVVVHHASISSGSNDINGFWLEMGL